MTRPAHARRKTRPDFDSAPRRRCLSRTTIWLDLSSEVRASRDQSGNARATRSTGKRCRTSPVSCHEGTTQTRVYREALSRFRSTRPFPGEAQRKREAIRSGCLTWPGWPNSRQCSTPSQIEGPSTVVSFLTSGTKRSVQPFRRRRQRSEGPAEVFLLDTARGGRPAHAALAAASRGPLRTS